jgi:hypothetical protein
MNKNATIVTQDLFDERVEAWLRPKAVQKIGIRGGSPELDVAIVEGERKRIQADSQKVIQGGSFNEHQSWLKSGKPLKEYPKDFHLENPVIFATWLAGKNGSNEVVFAEVFPEKEIGATYEENLFRDVMLQLKEEFGLKYRYTDRRSQLFEDIGAMQFDPKFLKTEPNPISLPKMDLFENQRLQGESAHVKAKSGSVGCLVEVGERELIATSVVPNDRSKIADTGAIVLLCPNDLNAVRRAVETFGSKREIYLISKDVNNEIKKLRPEPMPDRSKAAVAFAIGGYDVTADLNPRSKPIKNFIKRINEISYV